MSSVLNFATDAGMTGPLTIVSAPRNGGAAVTNRIAAPYAILGRHPRCTVQLSDPSVSKRHVYVQVISGHVFVLDLHSRRGTQVGGAFVSRGWLRPGQTLQVGDYDVRFFPEPSPTSNIPPDHSLGVALSLVLPETMPLICPLRGSVNLIGRDPSVHARVEDDRLDPFHAAVVCTATGAWVVCLQGPGGVRVNGKPVKAARVDVGSRVSLNGVEIRVESAPAEVSGELAITPKPGSMRDEFRELAVFLAQKFAALQQENTQLLKRQTELLQVIADACQRGLPVVGSGAAAPAADAPPEDIRPAPVPQPLMPRESEVLGDAHEWLIRRLQEMQGKAP